jgi:alkylation response protein AidB-like acyl-CoA dehydrogenase
MAIDFTMSAEQRKIQKMAREFSENILAPVIPAADKEPDPMLAYQKTKGAYIEAYKAGIAMAMLPKEYGGAELSCLDYVIACEEITSVDPGFACTCLCNGLGLMPVLWYGSERAEKAFPGSGDFRSDRDVSQRLDRRRASGRHRRNCEFRQPSSESRNWHDGGQKR